MAYLVLDLLLIQEKKNHFRIKILYDHMLTIPIHHVHAIFQFAIYIQILLNHEIPSTVEIAIYNWLISPSHFNK